MYAPVAEENLELLMPRLRGALTELEPSINVAIGWIEFDCPYSLTYGAADPDGYSYHGPGLLVSSSSGKRGSIGELLTRHPHVL